jgi:pyruvate dehydrogenase E2 component (dihydrolipoamide acetyltransferase)
MEDFRVIASQYDIDLDKLKEEKGELSFEILEQYIKENFYPKVKEEKKLSGIRKITAQRLSDSYRNAVHVTINMEVKADNLFNLRNKIEGNPSLTIIMLKLIAKALKDFPEANATLEGDKLTTYDSINIAVAIDTPFGLLTPVLRDVDRKSIKQLLDEYGDLVERARNGGLKEKDFVGGTFTITNLGMLDVDSFTPIINPPQIAILGINRIKDSIVIEDGLTKNIKTMYLSLSFDHRAIDGAPAARFLQRVKQYFEESDQIE